MSPNVVKQYVENIIKFKPIYIQGYASGVATIAHYMDSLKMCYPIKAVLTSSEKLTQEDRKIIERVFECQVFDRYGCGEEVVAAIECEEHNGYHVEIDRCWVEVVDENGKSTEGNIGDIVGTNLSNYAFPLIRYKIGDIGSIKYGSCACGRNTPIISELVGRSSEYLMSKNHIKQCSATVASNVIMPNGILAYQIEQVELNCFIVRFCSNCEKDISEAVRNAILEFVKNILDINNPIINIERLANIPVSENGKMKYLISQIQ